jgi:hypothetical protein
VRLAVERFSAARGELDTFVLSAVGAMARHNAAAATSAGTPSLAYRFGFFIDDGSYLPPPSAPTSGEKKKKEKENGNGKEKGKEEVKERKGEAESASAPATTSCTDASGCGHLDIGARAGKVRRLYYLSDDFIDDNTVEVYLPARMLWLFVEYRTEDADGSSAVVTRAVQNAPWVVQPPRPPLPAAAYAAIVQREAHAANVVRLESLALALAWDTSTPALGVATSALAASSALAFDGEALSSARAEKQVLMLGAIIGQRTRSFTAAETNSVAEKLAVALDAPAIGDVSAVAPAVATSLRTLMTGDAAMLKTVAIDTVGIDVAFKALVHQASTLLLDAAPRADAQSGDGDIGLCAQRHDTAPASTAAGRRRLLAEGAPDGILASCGGVRVTLRGASFAAAAAQQTQRRHLLTAADDAKMAMRLGDFALGSDDVEGAPTHVDTKMAVFPASGSPLGLCHGFKMDFQPVSQVVALRVGDASRGGGGGDGSYEIELSASTRVLHGGREKQLRLAHWYPSEKEWVADDDGCKLSSTSATRFGGSCAAAGVKATEGGVVAFAVGYAVTPGNVKIVDPVLKEPEKPDSRPGGGGGPGIGVIIGIVIGSLLFGAGAGIFAWRRMQKSAAYRSQARMLEPSPLIELLQSPDHSGGGV